MELVEYLNWDSVFFGFNIGRIKFDENCLRPIILEKALCEAKSRNIKCLYLEIPFVHPDILSFCSENKFSLVDYKMILSKTLPDNEAYSNDTNNNITAHLDDKYYSVLLDIVRQISKYSRYFFDIKFGEKKSLQLYEEWLRRSYYENFCDMFFIFLINDTPAGFITIRIKNGIPFIDLVGVLDSERGKGIATALIEESEKMLLCSGHKILKVVTQGHNIAALKTYQSLKFKIESVKIYYHKWME